MAVRCTHIHQQEWLLLPCVKCNRNSVPGLSLTHSTHLAIFHQTVYITQTVTQVLYCHVNLKFITTFKAIYVQA